MGTISVLLIAVSLSVDALAVSISIGVCSQRNRYIGAALKAALFFGVFQGVMPVIGWLAGRTLAVYIESIGNFVAFALLLFIGARMIYEALRPKTKAKPQTDPTKTPQLLLLAVATSIDALAVGVSLGYSGADVAFAAPVIGAITAVICFFGVFLGCSISGRFQKYSEVAGGVILIVIGIKMLVENL